MCQIGIGSIVMTSGTDTLFWTGSSGVEHAAHALLQGRIVAFPTETVYGLGADATNAYAVARLYEVKGRPSFNPLIVHVPDLVSAQHLGHFNRIAEILAMKFWPGPLTLVVPRKESGIASLVTAGLDTIAIRVPAHPLACELLRVVKTPIAAPSANPSGQTSPTRAQHVNDLFADKIAMILDGGSSVIGIESTIIGISGQRAILLRPGGLSREEIEQYLDASLLTAEKAVLPNSPGQLASHYAPHASVRLDADMVMPEEALLTFGSRIITGEASAKHRLNLSCSGDLQEAAMNLFDFLHRLDACDVSVIAVAPIPAYGLGEAINDRLSRAASPR